MTHLMSSQKSQHCLYYIADFWGRPLVFLPAWVIYNIIVVCSKYELPEAKKIILSYLQFPFPHYIKGLSYTSSEICKMFSKFSYQYHFNSLLLVDAYFSLLLLLCFVAALHIVHSTDLWIGCTLHSREIILNVLLTVFGLMNVPLNAINGWFSVLSSFSMWLKLKDYLSTWPR